MLADALLALQVLIAAVAAVYIALQVREMRIAQQAALEIERRKQAQGFIARFNSSDMIRIRAGAINALEHGSYETEKHEILAYLNFFDELALAMLYDLANEQICRQYFRQILLHTCSGFEMAFTDNPGRYNCLRKLREKWDDNIPEHPLTNLPIEKK